MKPQNVLLDEENQAVLASINRVECLENNLGLPNTFEHVGTFLGIHDD